MADRYANILRALNLEPVDVIVPGVDLERFKPRLCVGVVGRAYHTGRKGEALIQALIDEPYIEWKQLYDNGRQKLVKETQINIPGT